MRPFGAGRDTIDFRSRERKATGNLRGWRMELDPVEYVIIEFPGNRFTGDIAPAIAALVDRGLVHIIDLVFVRKDADGVVTYFEYDDLDELKGFAEIEGEADGLLSDADIAEMSVDLASDSSAIFIMWEDTWARDLGRAVRNAGGQLIAGGRIPYQAVEAALDNVAEAPSSDSMSQEEST
jgi:Family of unknown function (DUF6325)